MSPVSEEDKALSSLEATDWGLPASKPLACSGQPGKAFEPGLNSRLSECEVEGWAVGGRGVLQAPEAGGQAVEVVGSPGRPGLADCSLGECCIELAGCCWRPKRHVPTSVQQRCRPCPVLILRTVATEANRSKLQKQSSVYSATTMLLEAQETLTPIHLFHSGN